MRDRYGRKHARPVLPAGPPAGRARRAVRHGQRPRLGHARQPDRPGSRKATRAPRSASAWSRRSTWPSPRSLDDLHERGLLERDAGGRHGRVRPHPEAQHRRRPRPLAAGLQRRSWRAEASRAARSLGASDSQGESPADRPDHARRPRLHDLPAPGRRPRPRAQDRRRPPGPDQPGRHGDSGDHRLMPGSGPLRCSACWRSCRLPADVPPSRRSRPSPSHPTAGRSWPGRKRGSSSGPGRTSNRSGSCPRRSRTSTTSRSHLVATSWPRGAGRRPSRVRSSSSAGRRGPGSTTTSRTTTSSTHSPGRTTAAPGPRRVSTGPCRSMPPTEKPSGSLEGHSQGRARPLLPPRRPLPVSAGHRPEPPGLGRGVRPSLAAAREPHGAGPGPRPPPVATRRRAADGRLDWRPTGRSALATDHRPDGPPVEAGSPPARGDLDRDCAAPSHRRRLRRRPRATDRPRYGRDPRDIHALDGRAHSLASAPDGRALVVGGEAGRLVRIDLEPPPDSSRDRERARARARLLDGDRGGWGSRTTSCRILFRAHGV